MTPTVAIRFPALSDLSAQATVRTGSPDRSATVKTKTIVWYTQTVITLDVPTETRASVEIIETGLYLMVLITGQLTMERQDANPIPLSKSARHCQALYLCKGDYSVVFAPGKHRLVCFGSTTTWIERIKQTLPLIHEASANLRPHQVAVIFPRYSLPKVLADYLLVLTYQSANETSANELDHFHKLNRIMAHYDHLLAKSRQNHAPRRQYAEIVNAFLHHCKHSLLLGECSTIESIAAAIHVSPKTLNRAFQSVSQGQITPGRMLQQLRMAMAHRLLSREEKVCVQHAAHLLGYTDTSAFTKAYRQVQGHLPSEAHRFAEKRLNALHLPSPK